MRVTDERLAELLSLHCKIYSDEGSMEILETFQYEVEKSFGLIAEDLQDARADIQLLLEYLGLVVGVAHELNQSLENLIGLHSTHPKHPEMDTEAARKKRGWMVIPAACAASERYERIVNGRDVGCLEGDETPEDRGAFMASLNELRSKVGES